MARDGEWAAERPVRAMQVAVLLYDGVCPFELGLVTEVLDWSDKPPGWYSHVRCSHGGRPVVAPGGLSIPVEAGVEALDAADVILVPGWNLEAEEPASEALVAALRRAQARGARLVGLCTGAFLFGEAGVIQERRVTTHWRRAELFRRRYPSACLLDDQLYVDDGEILTSSGSAAGMDLLVHMVARDFGLEIANALSARHTMAPHRAAEQAQRVARPLPRRGDRSLAPLLDGIRGRLDERWTIRRMADEVGMSARTLVRRFSEATGSSPGEWLILQRVLTARVLLQNTRHGIEDIAAAVGLGSAAALRHHFRRRLGASPTDIRRNRGAVVRTGADHGEARA